MSCQGSDPCVCAKISGIATGQTLQVARKECMATGCFDVQKNDFGERSSLFVAVLSEMGVDNIDTRVAQGFVRAAVKNEVKSCH